MLASHGRDAFIQTLFRVAADKYRETIIVPWEGQVALISAWNYRNVNFEMELFDLPMKEAKKLAKLTNSKSVTTPTIPSLIGTDLDDGEAKFNIAPLLYITWAVGDPESFTELAADERSSMTGILEAIYEANGDGFSGSENLGVSNKSMTKWASKLCASKDSDLAKCGKFVLDTLRSGPDCGSHEDDDEQEDDDELDDEGSEMRACWS